MNNRFSNFVLIPIALVGLLLLGLDTSFRPQYSDRNQAKAVKITNAVVKKADDNNGSSIRLTGQAKGKNIDFAMENWPKIKDNKTTIYKVANYASENNNKNLYYKSRASIPANDPQTVRFITAFVASLNAIYFWVLFRNLKTKKQD